MAEKEYKKLPGGGTKRGAFLDVVRTRTSLWQGKDHLLYLSSTGYTEDYKRFYYGDIQAITIRKTIRYMVWNIILLTSLVSFGAAAYSYSEKFLAVSLYTVAFFSFLFLVINLLMGQTCICELYTQVSTEELYSLKRLRTAKKVINIITPLIEEKQRDLPSAASNLSSSSAESRVNQ
ncbi:MAG: hypothetical protein ABSC11_02290 [Smithella sp.]|jgi:hypothetical protein